jgi:DNA-binding NarL/FixJ family response regulator
LEQIRILLVDMPRLVHEMVESAVSAQRDMQVVGSVHGPGEVADAVRTSRPSFVIVGVDDEAFLDGCLEAFDDEPKLKVLGIEADAGEGYLYELRPVKRPLGEISPSGIVDAIREALATVGR